IDNTQVVLPDVTEQGMADVEQMLLPVEIDRQEILHRVAEKSHALHPLDMVVLGGMKVAVDHAHLCIDRFAPYSYAVVVGVKVALAARVGRIVGIVYQHSLITIGCLERPSERCPGGLRDMDRDNF